MNYFIYDALTRLVDKEGYENAAKIAFDVIEKTEKEENLMKKYWIWNKDLPGGCKIANWSKVKDKLYGKPVTQLELAQFFTSEETLFIQKMLFISHKMTISNVKKGLASVFNEVEASLNDFDWKVYTFYQEVTCEYETSEVEVSVALTPKGFYFMNSDTLLSFAEVLEQYKAYTYRNEKTNKEFGQWVEEDLLDDAY